MRKRISMILVTMMMAIVAAGCGKSDETSFDTSDVYAEQTETKSSEKETSENDTSGTEISEDDSSADNSNDMFTERDMAQEADLSEAETLAVQDGEDLTITSEGVYVLSGSSKDTTVYVEAGDEDKVQIVLDGVSITNEDSPAIYVKSADKVFVTTVSGTDNTMSVSQSFVADGDTNLDGVIFSKDDLVLNGKGTLSITSTDNAVVCKDTLKITGGTITAEAAGTAFEANDAIEIADGSIEVTRSIDALHAENDEDDSVGSIYIGGGSLRLTAEDDTIHATTTVQIDGGELDLTGAECIEATSIQINEGTIKITASDDGINAGQKSSQLSPVFEMNGGEVTITMGAGDTDGVDSNGDIYINGGTISISGQSTFDCDGNAVYNGGTIIENGQETNTITNQMMGGPGMGGFGRPDGSTPGGDFGEEFGNDGGFGGRRGPR